MNFFIAKEIIYIIIWHHMNFVIRYDVTVYNVEVKSYLSSV